MAKPELKSTEVLCSSFVENQGLASFRVAMRFDLQTLDLVLAIAETRSITRGAAREHLALAAASKRLSDLETRLGVPLFERRARGVEPTEAGHALVRHVRSLRAQLHALESEVLEFGRGIRATCAWPRPPVPSPRCCPPAAAFSRAHPGIRISLEDLTSAEVQAAVAEGRADVGIFVPPVRDPRLRHWPYATSRLAVVVPRGHLLARRSAVGFDALLDFDLIGLHLGAAAQERMRERAEALGRRLARGCTCAASMPSCNWSKPASAWPCCRHGRRALARLFDVVVLELQDELAEREYRLAVREQPVLPPALQKFVAVLCPSAAASDMPAPAARQSTPSKVKTRP